MYVYNVFFYIMGATFYNWQFVSSYEANKITKKISYFKTIPQFDLFCLQIKKMHLYYF